MEEEGHAFSNREDRKEWQNAQKIVEQFDNLHGDVLEAGCGPGFFTIELAKAVAGKGLISAIDKDPKMIEELRQKLAPLDPAVTRSVRLVTGDVERAYFPERAYSFIFLSNVFHDLSDPKWFLVRANRILKPDGEIINIDWSDKKPGMGPPMDIRISEEKCLKLFTDAKFYMKKEIYGGDYHYGYIFSKTSS